MAEVVLMDADDPPPDSLYGAAVAAGSIPLTPDAAGVPLAVPMHGTFIPAPHGAAIADALKSGPVLFGPAVPLVAIESVRAAMYRIERDTIGISDFLYVWDEQIVVPVDPVSHPTLPADVVMTDWGPMVPAKSPAIW